MLWTRIRALMSITSTELLPTRQRTTGFSGQIQNDRNVLERLTKEWLLSRPAAVEAQAWSSLARGLELQYCDQHQSDTPFANYFHAALVSEYGKLAENVKVAGHCIPHQRAHKSGLWKGTQKVSYNKLANVGA